MALTLSCEQVRRLDADAVRELNIPSLLLMENAARGAAEFIRNRFSQTSITILCGPGNNGGDGLALARLLASSGIEADTILVRTNKELSIDAAVNYQLLQRTHCRICELEVEEISRRLNCLSSTDLVVDALLGTGIRGEVRSPWREIIAEINACLATVVSLDVPSGLDCDTGLPCGTAVLADFTVTFAAMKQGLVLPAAKEYVGEVHLAHIGLPVCWMEAWHQKLMLPNV